MRVHAATCKEFGVEVFKRRWTAYRWQHLALGAAGVAVALFAVRSGRKEA